MLNYFSQFKKSYNGNVMNKDELFFKNTLKY